MPEGVILADSFVAHKHDPKLGFDHAVMPKISDAQHEGGQAVEGGNHNGVGEFNSHTVREASSRDASGSAGAKESCAIFGSPTEERYGGIVPWTTFCIAGQRRGWRNASGSIGTP